MNLNLTRQFELGDAAQILAQDFRLDLELMLVSGVLVVASAAAAEIRARRLDAVRRRFYDFISVRAGEARFRFGNNSFDVFPSKYAGNKHGLAASAFFIRGRTGGEARESVAAIDELFNV